MGVASVPNQMFLMTILGLARQIDVVSTWMRSPAALLKAFLLRPGTYRVSPVILHDWPLTTSNVHPSVQSSKLLCPLVAMNLLPHHSLLVPKSIDAPTEMQNGFCRPNLGTLEEKTMFGLVRLAFISYLSTFWIQRVLIVRKECNSCSIYTCSVVIPMINLKLCIV